MFDWDDLRIFLAAARAGSLAAAFCFYSSMFLGTHEDALRALREAGRVLRPLGSLVLTQDNPTMAYGVGTVEAIARAVNRDLNPGAVARVPLSVIPPSQQTPDETIP